MSRLCEFFMQEEEEALPPEQLELFDLRPYTLEAEVVKQTPIGSGGAQPAISAEGRIEEV